MLSKEAPCGLWGPGEGSFRNRACGLCALLKQTTHAANLQRGLLRVALVGRIQGCRVITLCFNVFPIGVMVYWHGEMGDAIEEESGSCGNQRFHPVECESADAPVAGHAPGWTHTAPPYWTQAPPWLDTCKTCMVCL